MNREVKIIILLIGALFFVCLHADANNHVSQGKALKNENKMANKSSYSKL